MQYAISTVQYPNTKVLDFCMRDIYICQCSETIRSNRSSEIETTSSLYLALLTCCLKANRRKTGGQMKAERHRRGDAPQPPPMTMHLLIGLMTWHWRFIRPIYIDERLVIFHAPAAADAAGTIRPKGSACSSSQAQSVISLYT